jgi:hypothetical protein
MKNRKFFSLLVGFIAVFLLCGIVALLPPVSDRLANKYNDLRIRIQYALNPPEEVVFVPKEQAPTAVEATIQTQPVISNMHYEDQHGLWNYCAPANLSMMLTHWGWVGNRETVGPYLKPVEQDKNVMPYEMANYVIDHTNLNIIIRYGGTVDVLKRLLASGYPVLIEKGVYFFETLTGREGWMGHYNVLIGYDDTTGEFIINDTYIKGGENHHFSYDEIIEQWRSFNYVFIVIYPPDEEQKVNAALGVYADENTANGIALETARNEINPLDGIDRYFAMYNLGTSNVNINDYLAASHAYDDAFTYYATLPEERRPWRMLWYQTGPYAAYYYTARYQDVIDLANQTINTASDPYLEESYYWRARAKVSIGDQDGAIEDLRTSLKLHPDFAPSLDLMHSLGIYE